MNIKFGSDEGESCIELSLHAWCEMQLTISNYSSVFLQDLRNLWYCFISEFFHVGCIIYFSMRVTSAWSICMSHLDCSVGQVGQQVWPTSTLDPTLILA